MTYADVLNAAADVFERQEPHRTTRDMRNIGGAMYSALFEQARRVYGWPAIEAMQRHLKLDQLQHWRETDPAAALRAAAKEPATVDVEVAALREQITDLHAALLDAVGWFAMPSPEALVREVAEQMSRMEAGSPSWNANSHDERAARRTVRTAA
jgi:hypothetical protein